MKAIFGISASKTFKTAKMVKKFLMALKMQACVMLDTLLLRPSLHFTQSLDSTGSQLSSTVSFYSEQ
jgi:hypothetical protein